MSYVDAIFDQENDIVKIVERNQKGEREYKDIPAKHTFYYLDPKGKYRSIYGTSVSKVVCKTTKDLRKELAINSDKKIFEADINPVFACLSEHYLHADAPKLNVAFFDIEVDMQPYAVPSQNMVKIRKKQQ